MRTMGLFLDRLIYKKLRFMFNQFLFSVSLSLFHFEGEPLPYISIIPSSSSMAFSHCLFGICFLGICLFSPVLAQLQRFHHSLKGDGSLSFLVIGDWGRQGAYNQSEVALQMGRTADEIDIDFVVSTGDNFYDNGLASVNDPLFEESFTRIYTANSLRKQWYSVLGNHDYRGNVEAQLDPVLAKIDSRWLCRRSFIVDAEIAEFFFVDTTPFVDEYFVTPNEHSYDWKGVEPRKKYIANALQELESGLRNSYAKWKIVVGHHAIRSMGHHGDTNELIKQLLPILQANDVDFYINGHDHCLEHISDRDSPIQFFTSGGGSKAWRGDVSGHGENGVHLFYDGQGFMSVELNHKKAKILFYDVFGRVMHKWHVSKPLHSAM